MFEISKIQNADGVAGSLREAAERAGDAVGPALSDAWTWLREQGPEQATALVIFLGLFFVLRVLRAFLAGALRSRKRPENAARNVASRLIASTWSLFLLILAALAVAPFTPGLSARFIDILETLFMAALFLQGAVWLSQLVTSVSAGYLNARDGDDLERGAGSTAVSLIKTLAGIIIWALAIAMILTNLGYNIAPVIAGLGVGGLAIGLAAQNIFKDLFASLSIIFDRPFVRGDVIAFGDDERMGEVEKIGMKSTRLRALSGEQVVIGNSLLLDSEISNFRRMAARRAAFEMGVVYQTPHALLKDIPGLVEQALGGVEGVRFDRCHLKSFGDSAIVFDTVFWIDTRDYRIFLDHQQAALLAIHAAFERAGAVFAYPTRTLHVETMPAGREVALSQ